MTRAPPPRVMSLGQAALLMVAGLLGFGCERDSDAASDAPAPATAAPAPGPSQAHREVQPPPKVPEQPNEAAYGWLTSESASFPKPTETLRSRFPAPANYERVGVAPGSFGEWLRGLPVAAADTPVLTHRGDVALPAGDKYVAGVIAIDVGKKDLQHGPDVIVRLHAEWLWSKKDFDSIEYRAAGRQDMPFKRWLRGERFVSRGGQVGWFLTAVPREEPRHEDLREYLDTVFTWINSRSLLKQAERIEPKDMSPGDFFVHDGKPGDAVIVLDMAQHREHRRRLVMLARAMQPAQSVHVVSPGAGIAWFEVSPPTPLLTPSTDEFEWSVLRRMPERTSQ